MLKVNHKVLLAKYILVYPVHCFMGIFIAVCRLDHRLDWVWIDLGCLLVGTQVHQFALYFALQ